MRSISPRLAAVVIVVLVLVIGGLVVVSRSGSDSAASPSSSADGADDRTTTPSVDDAPDSTQAADATTTTAITIGPATGPDPVAPEVPLNVSVSDTSGLQDGDLVTVKVTPKAGAVVYGFEMFVCAGGETYEFDADVRPLYTGKCVIAPVSAASDDYQVVKGMPPYDVAEGSIKVGVGSNSYTTQDGRPVTITCGAGHPCALVLKLQFEKAYGFKTYPLTFG